MQHLAGVATLRRLWRGGSSGGVATDVNRARDLSVRGCIDESTLLHLHRHASTEYDCTKYDCTPQARAAFEHLLRLDHTWGDLLAWLRRCECRLWEGGGRPNYYTLLGSPCDAN